MAADVLFLEYPKCSTCQKAKKWLDAHGVKSVTELSGAVEVG